jgi:CHRD domain/PEP-CTERM motif
LLVRGLLGFYIPGREGIMKRLLLFPIALLYASVAQANPITLTTVLSGLNEIPPVASPATGQATVTLDPDAQTLQLFVTFSGLTTPDVAAHIHCCLPSPFAPMNVGVATTVPAFPGFPLGVTSGTYTSPVFDLTQPLIYNPAFITLQGGLPQAEAALIAGLLNNETYLNIHTALNQGGEIRGILSSSTSAVPEPGTLSLLGLGITSLIAARKRRRDRVR